MQYFVYELLNLINLFNLIVCFIWHANYFWSFRDEPLQTAEITMLMSTNNVG